MSHDPHLFPFDNSYARLPDRFFARLPPTPVASPELIVLNEELALELGLQPEQLRTPEGVDVLAGNRTPAGADPLAMAYAGFQFGNWVPQLGDGRAILLGEVVDRRGVRRDIQLKGAGPTPFSRSGDGRAGLGPVLREYIVSESMARLGVPTTRSLAAVSSGEVIWRERQLPGAVLTRVAQSHIRVGTFQFFAARSDVEALKSLADHVIARHYPDVTEADQPYLELLGAVVKRQAELIAGWQGIGFIHGVMNTDNTSIAGETIDYGPCAFMDAYHPDTVYSSIDRLGRYAYGNQPAVAQWNLAGFAQALLPLLGRDTDEAIAGATQRLESFDEHFTAHHRSGMWRKLGLSTPRESDAALMHDLLACMSEQRADFTLTFRRLCEVGDAGGESLRRVGRLFEDATAFESWAARWLQRLASESRPEAERQRAMRSVNPAFIPRNHLIEEALRAAVDDANLEPFRTLLGILSTPYDEQPGHEGYAAPPRPDQIVQQTFCGT